MFLPAAPAESQRPCHVTGLLQGCKLMQMQTENMHPQQCSVGKSACTDVERGLSDQQTDRRVRSCKPSPWQGASRKSPHKRVMETHCNLCLAALPQLQTETTALWQALVCHAPVGRA